MTRTYALLKLLELGPLTRKEIREITGWPEDKVQGLISYLSSKSRIIFWDNKWTKAYPNGTLQTETI
jgi:hypothetical protein